LATQHTTVIEVPFFTADILGYLRSWAWALYRLSFRFSNIFFQRRV